jgi:hypothetical protein
VDTFCDGRDIFNQPAVCSVIVDRSLMVSRTYLVIVSDKRADEAGAYELLVNCLFGPCPTTPVNRSPVLLPIGGKQARKTEELALDVRATDPDGNTLRFSASGLPPGATFVDHHDGTATFRWTPGPDVPAEIPLVTFTVTDNGAQ